MQIVNIWEPTTVQLQDFEEEKKGKGSGMPGFGVGLLGSSYPTMKSGFKQVTEGGSCSSLTLPNSLFLTGA